LSTIGTASLTGTVNIGRNSAGNFYFTGEMEEIILYPTNFTSTQQSNMCHNQFGWGTGVSC
jgi:hypothetical protein